MKQGDVGERAGRSVRTQKASRIDHDILAPGPVPLSGGACQAERGDACLCQAHQFAVIDLAIAVAVRPQHEARKAVIGRGQNSVAIAVEGAEAIEIGTSAGFVTDEAKLA